MWERNNTAIRQRLCQAHSANNATRRAIRAIASARLNSTPPEIPWPCSVLGDTQSYHSATWKWTHWRTPPSIGSILRSPATSLQLKITCCKAKSSQRNAKRLIVKMSVEILQVQHCDCVKFRHFLGEGYCFFFFFFFQTHCLVGGKSIKTLTEKTVFWAPHDTWANHLGNIQAKAISCLAHWTEWQNLSFIFFKKKREVSS